MVDSKDKDRRLTKNEKRRQKKKEEKSLASTAAPSSTPTVEMKEDKDVEDIEIDYVSAEVKELESNSYMFEQFKSIFEKFAKPEELTSGNLNTTDAGQGGALVQADEDSSKVEEQKKLSKKKKKLMSRLSVAELKQLVNRPDVVEAHDVTASDPRLLVYLKAYRNTVPIPRHWCHKRKYLQGKRGIEKPPFQLPEFIAETGISKIRDTVIEQEALKKSKQKARDKMQPKMGKIDIDYQVLHDAFFKYQTKPKITGHGDLYYEGKEFEVQMKECKPGILSADLKTALAMTENCPPPWLVHMQRYGPPPSYPSMRIPGLSAPIPPGCQFGYQPGQWGKPPVDEYGRPLYGDVFGVLTTEEDLVDTAVDKTTRWGELTVFESESEDEEEEEEDEQAAAGGKARAREDTSGVETPSTLDGISTINSGLETPDTIDLRKRTGGTETPDSVYGGQRELYQVIPERQMGLSGQLFGSDRGYALPGKGDVQISINPDDLEDQLKDKDHMRDAYEAQAAGGEGGFEDFEGDDARGKRKRRVDANAVAKRYKDFKF